MTGKGVVRFRF